MKKSSSLTKIFVVLLLFITGQQLQGRVSATVDLSQGVFVSPSGSDSNLGTIDSPFLTIDKARQVVRTLNSNMTADINVYLRAGRYELSSALAFDEADSGTNNHNVIYRRYQNEAVTISGGVAVTGWVQHSGSIYKADVSTNRFRQFYVEGARGIRARNPNSSYRSLTSWNPNTGINITSGDVSASLARLTKVEVVIQKRWNNNYFRIASVAGSLVTFQNPERTDVFEQDNPPRDDGQKYYAENALEFIDSDGEWYINTDDNKVYFQLRAGEASGSIVAYRPNLQTLVQLHGSALGTNVHNIQFFGLTFEHSNWLYPDSNGAVWDQANVVFTDPLPVDQLTSYPGVRVPGAISIQNANNLRFERCTFRKMGASGIVAHVATTNCSFIGNVFRDIAATGIVIDDNLEGATGVNSLKVCSGNVIQNNYIDTCGQDYWDGEGIVIGYGVNTVIEHNEVTNLPHTGISVGWGWTSTAGVMHDNLIRYNLLHDITSKLGDSGALYNLSNQPGTTYAENYIHHITKVSTAFSSSFSGLMLDNGSSGSPGSPMIVRDNVFANIQEDVIHDGSSCCVTLSNNNGSSAATIANAGIEPAYQDIKFPPAGSPPIATVTSPLQNSTFIAGDVITYGGTGTDPDDGILPPSACSWTILLHHDTHTHPAAGPIIGTGGTFTIPSSGHDFSGNTSYEFILTVTDSNSLQNSSSAFIIPQKVKLSFSTLPPGLQMTIDGVSTDTPLVKDALIGFHYDIGAPNQTQGANQYTFTSWSDGGAQTHNILVPGASAAYTANYQVSTSPLPSGLVLSYGFNEGSGTSAADSSGNNRTATLLNGAGWSPSGQYGASLNLDGIDDYVEVPNPALPTGDFSYSLWIKRDPAAGWRALFNGRDTLLELAVNDSGFLELWINGSGPTSTVQIPANTWTHAAVTRAGSLVTIYVNGAQNTTGASAEALNFSICPFRIGVDSDNNQICATPQPGLNGYFDGAIDELRVYNRALSLAEIQIDMNTPSSPPDTTPPIRSNGQPTGTLPVGTTQTTISLTTDESATARYSLVPGTTYGAMTGLFSTTGGTTHSTIVTGLSDGGSYSFYVRCQDAAGNANTGDFVISFSVASPDTTSPTVNVTAPVTGATVSGSISVTANASDNVGVAGVQFLLDGANLGAEDTTSPYSMTWDTLSVANGAHTLVARARDAAGNVATTPDLNVTVANSVMPGLVAAYSFNEGIGNTVADASGNNNVGTITGATWTTAGKFGNALSFNGLFDWVTIPDANSLDLTNGLTLEAWVFPTNTPAGWRMIIAKEQSDGLAYYLYASSRGTNQPAFGIFVSSAERNLIGGTRLIANTWTHVAATYNGSIQLLYINGVQVATGTQAGSIVVSNGVLRIGGNSPFGEYFKGLIDDVRIFNVVRTEIQIQTDMNSPVVP